MPGAVGSSHAIATTTLAQSGTQYRVAVSNASGNVISSAARLSVTAAIVAPTITVQPASQTVTAPATATFNVTATGTAPSYQWQMSVDAGATFTAVPSAPDSPTLTIAATTTALSGNRYRVRVINAAGTATSSVVTLTVNLHTCRAVVHDAACGTDRDRRGRRPHSRLPRLARRLRRWSAALNGTNAANV